PKDMGAAISSGSFQTDGMAVIPCSMKSLAGIVSGYSDNLVLRAADVTLKERRTLALVPRETPLSMIHLENMLKAARAGALVLPAMPGFYHRPKTMDDLINHVVGKTLDAFKIKHNLFKRWGEKQAD
ncbi:MAG: UbiX family flavin prenyltransferase, partial [Thaumarchaeota archaeon]|nr:UbiX family flavin prenyltransferase [Nitrososphaerota archaeon]